MADIDAIRARAAAATPGPWGWFGNIKHGGPYLATQHGGRVFVMQFARLGMAAAQPVFQVRDDPDHPEWGHMVKGADLAIYEAEHRADIKGFDNPDAEFIAHARQDVEDLLALVDELVGERPPYHVLEVDEQGWSIQHEASCFPDLLSCPIHQTHRALADQGVELPPPGRYRLTPSGLIATGADGYAVEVDADA